MNDDRPAWIQICIDIIPLLAVAVVAIWLCFIS